MRKFFFQVRHEFVGQGRPNAEHVAYRRFLIGIVADRGFRIRNGALEFRVDLLGRIVQEEGQISAEEEGAATKSYETD